MRAHAPGPVPDLTITLLGHAVAGTFLALLRWWMESEAALTAKQMDAYFQRLVLPGIQKVLADEVSV